MADEDRLDEAPLGMFARERAMREYARAWNRYYALTQGKLWPSSTATEGAQQEAFKLQEEMDRLQLRICRGPGKVWRRFVDTLPGFNDAWSPRGVTEMIDDITDPETS